MTHETDYAWWTNAIAGNFGPVSDGYPECGFYRRRQRDKTFAAVAIWRNEAGNLVALETCVPYGSKPVDPNDIWTWVAKHPIPEERYRAYVDNGQWPDMDAAVAEHLDTRGIGDNRPPDEIDALADQIESAKAGVSAYERIEDDDTLAKAQSLRSRLLELSRTADRLRVAEKQPYLEAGKVVDAKYQPLVKDAKAAADAVAKAMSAWETEKLRREREAQPKAEPASAPASAPATPIRGAYGRAASVKLVKVVTNVTDMDALLGFLKTHPEMIDLATKLAQRAVDKGIEVPGIETEERRKVA